MSAPPADVTGDNNSSHGAESRCFNNKRGVHNRFADELVFLTAELAALLSPSHAQVFLESSNIQGAWLAALQNGFDNVRRKEGAREDPSHIDFIQPGLLGQRPLIRRFPTDDSTIPVVSAGYGLQQRRHRMHRCLAVCAGRDDQSDLSPATLWRHIELEGEKSVLSLGAGGPGPWWTKLLVVENDGAKGVLADP